MFSNPNKLGRDSIPLSGQKFASLTADDVILFFETIKKEAVSDKFTHSDSKSSRPSFANACERVAKHFLCYLSDKGNLTDGQRRNLGGTIKMLCDQHFFTDETKIAASTISLKIAANQKETFCDDTDKKTLLVILRRLNSEIKPDHKHFVLQPDTIKSIRKHYQIGNDAVKKYHATDDEKLVLKNEILAVAMNSFNDMSKAFQLMLGEPNGATILENNFMNDELTAIYTAPCQIFYLEAKENISCGEFDIARNALGNMDIALSAIPENLRDRHYEETVTNMREMRFTYFHSISQKAFESKQDDAIAHHYCALAKSSLAEISPYQDANSYYHAAFDVAETVLKTDSRYMMVYNLDLARDIINKIPAESKTYEINEFYLDLLYTWYENNYLLAENILDDVIKEKIPEKYHIALSIYEKILLGETGKEFNFLFGNDLTIIVYSRYASTLIELAVIEANKFEHEAALNYLDRIPVDYIYKTTLDRTIKLGEKYDKALNIASQNREIASQFYGNWYNSGKAQDDNYINKYTPAYFQRAMKKPQTVRQRPRAQSCINLGGA